MPVSNDNQDYGKDDQQNTKNAAQQDGQQQETKMTSDDLKGKKVDADVTQESDRPLERR